MKAFALALATVLLLAGCTSGGGNGDDDDGTGTSGPSGTGSGTSSSTRSSTSGTGTGAGAPGTITVDLTRSTPDGPVPLQVNLTLDADFRRGSATATPSGVAWTLKVHQGNQTNDTLQRSGTTLPANLTLNLTTVGNHTLVAEVSAPGYTTANDTVIAVARAASAGGPLFFDGAETDGSQWAFSNELVIDLILEREATGREHPEGGWAASTAQAKSGTKSWHAPYPDHYEGRMTSVATPTAASTLTYWYKGGSESNDVDGLYVLAGPDAGALAEVAYHGGAAVDWTPVTVSLPAGSKVVQFLMYSDASCSSDPVPVGGADGAACGAGWNAGGFYVDDVTLA